MDKKLFLKQYILTQNSKVILDLDFSKDYSFEEYKDFFLKDYINITQLYPENYTSRFIFNNNIVLTKHHAENSMEFLVNGERKEDFFEYLKTEYGLIITPEIWSSRIIDSNPLVGLQDLIPKLNSQLTSGLTSIDEMKKQIFKGKTEDQIKKIEKLIDTSEKIRILEGEIELYQNSRIKKEEYEKKTNMLSNDRKTMEEKRASIEHLIKSQGEILKEIEKMKANNVSEIHDSIKFTKIQNRVKELKNLKKSTAESVKKVIKSEESVFVGRQMVVLVFVQICLTIVFYIQTFEINIILLGLVSLFTILIATLVMNTYKSNRLVIKVTSQPDQIARIDDSKLFIDSAMFKALKYELQSIDNSIKIRLNGKSIEEFERDLVELDSKIKNLKDESQLQRSLMTPEEYYKKRRELDILKIEKENIEYSKDISIDMEEINALVDLKVKSQETNKKEDGFDRNNIKT